MTSRHQTSDTMPKIDGVITREADHLMTRPGQPSRDESMFGDPIPPTHKVIVYKRECEQRFEGEDPIYDPATAPAIPQDHIAPNRAFGPWRKQENREDGKWINGEHVEVYWTAPYYVVQGKTVYQGTVYMTEDPEERLRKNIERINRKRERKRQQKREQEHEKRKE